MEVHNRSCPSLRWVGMDDEQIVGKNGREMRSLGLALFAVSLWVSCGVLSPSSCPG